MKRFVVLDRDGTIIEERSYLSDPRDVALIPGAVEALRRLRKMGLGLVVVTNQSGVGRGFFDEGRLTEIHESLFRMLEAEKIRMDGLYFCPHVPEDACSCRKPQTGLLEKAARELGFDPAASIVIGDKGSDIEMGRRVGATTLLVRTGYGAEFENTVGADFVVDDLFAASETIRSLLRQERKSTDDH